MKQISKAYQKILDKLGDSAEKHKPKQQKQKKSLMNHEDLINSFVPSKCLKKQKLKMPKQANLKKQAMKKLESDKQESLSDIFLTLTARLKNKENEISC